MKAHISYETFIPKDLITGPNALQWAVQKKTSLGQLGTRTVALFLFLGKTETVIESAEQTKIQLEIPHLPFLCQDEQGKPLALGLCD